MRIKLGVLIGALTLTPVFLAAPSQAVAPPQPATAPSTGTGPAATIRYSFEMVDRDADGLITRAEAALVPELLKNFGNLDRNNDDRLDRAEFVAFSR